MASAFGMDRTFLRVLEVIALFLLAAVLWGCEPPVSLQISITPTSATQGDPPFTMFVQALQGGSFEFGDEVVFQGQRQLTTIVNSHTLSTPITASMLATPGAFDVGVQNFESGGTISNVVTFTVNPKPPKPVITGTNPTSVTAGGPSFTLQILGTGFVAASVVQVNGNTLTPLSVDVVNQVIAADITNSMIVSDGDLSLVVVNPGNNASDPWIFKINKATPSPAITSIVPNTVVGGSPPFTLVINGTNFDPKATVSVSGSVRGAAFVNSGNMTVGITAPDLASAGNLPVQVTNPGPISSNIVSLAVTANPAPTITSINPVNVGVGGPDFTLDVLGTNFQNNSTATVGGVSRVLTVLTGTDAQISVKAADIATVGPVSIAITNPAPGGGTGTSILFVINPNAVPTITSFNPTFAVAGGTAFTLNIIGTNFLPASTATINGASRAISFVNGTEVQMGITVSDIQATGSLNIIVSNPAPGGGPSSPAAFPVVSSADVAPVPVLVNLQPSALGAGNGTAQMLISGTGFVPTSVVSINGTPRATTFVTPTSLTTILTPADDAVAATLPVVVTNPPLGGGTSNTMSVIVNQSGGVLDPLLSISPSQVAPGSTGLALNVNAINGNYTGDNIQIDGQTRVTTFVQTPFSITADILASDLVTPRIAEIRMFFDATHGGPALSDFIPLIIEPTGNPVPSVLSVARNAVTAGGPAFVTEVDGTNFIPNTTIGVNGFPRPTTFISSTAVDVTILAEDIAAPGTILIDAVNPPPGGGTSFTQTITVLASPAALTSTISGAFTAYLQGVSGSGDSVARTITEMQFVVDGKGNITSGTVEEFGGGASQKSVDISGSAIVADANSPGRMSIHLNGHGAAIAASYLTAYVDAAGNGTIIVGTPGNTVPKHGLGEIKQQTDAPYSEASFGRGCKVDSLSSSFPSGGKDDGAPISGTIYFSSGGAFFTGTVDVADAGGTAPMQIVTATMTTPDPATGRFVGRISGLPGGEQATVGYLQGANSFSFLVGANGKQPTLMVCGGK